MHRRKRGNVSAERTEGRGVTRTKRETENETREMTNTETEVDIVKGIEAGRGGIEIGTERLRIGTTTEMENESKNE